MSYTIACDGSSLANGKGGAIGWAWARSDGQWLSNGYYTGTNQRAELWALWSVLKFHPVGDLNIQMDSQYALNTVDKWAEGWARRGWRKADGQPVLNVDLVRPVLELKHAHQGRLSFQWVKGHRKDNAYPLNTLADQRAGEGARRAAKATLDLPGSLSSYLDSKGRTSMKQELLFMTSIHNGLQKG